MILKATYTDGREKLPEMKRYLENSDYEKYMIEAHSVKSITAGKIRNRRSEFDEENIISRR